MRAYAFALLVLTCTPTPVAPETGADCERFCAAVAKLRCMSEWGIEPSDGGCMDVCILNTGQRITCPRKALAATTCRELDERSRCE